MSLFRRSDEQSERTPEQREHARRVREARRLGLPDPSPDDAWEPEGAAEEMHEHPAEEWAAEAHLDHPAYVEDGAHTAHAYDDGALVEDHHGPDEYEPAAPVEDDAPVAHAQPSHDEDPAAGEPERHELEPDPEPELTWVEPERQPAVPVPEPEPELEPESAADPEPKPSAPDLPPTQPHDLDDLWTEPPAPARATRAHSAPLPRDAPPSGLRDVPRQPPALPARMSARPLPKPPRRRYTGTGARRGPTGPPARRRASWLGRILALIAIVGAAAVLWFLFSLFQPGKGEGNGRVAVTIPKGATPREIGDLLADRGVVSSGFFFALRARLGGQRDDLEAGRFVLAKDMSYGAALDHLAATPAAPPTVRITIPEGRSRREAAPLVKQAGISGSYLRASVRQAGFSVRRYRAPRGTRTLEGFLFPATYELPEGKATADRLVKEQLKAFQQNFAEVDLRRARRANLTPYEVLIIASMVEREAQVAKERPQIAAVIYNRLRDGMTLGIDATTRYELNEWTRPLRVSELEHDTPYNTRTRQGLPPTPIGNPGLASIRAAASPAHVDSLYYVVKPGTCGQHDFSSNDAEFQRDVAAYEAARARNGGKSPTKCP